jgi:hypothetical protein
VEICAFLLEQHYFTIHARHAETRRGLEASVFTVHCSVTLVFGSAW